MRRLSLDRKKQHSTIATNTTVLSSDEEDIEEDVEEVRDDVDEGDESDDTDDEDDDEESSSEEDELDDNEDESDSTSSSEEEEDNSDDSGSSSSSDEYDSDDELVRTKIVFDDSGEIRVRNIATDASHTELRQKLRKEHRIDHDNWTLHYYDGEGDKITISSKRDLRLALRDAYKRQSIDEEEEEEAEEMEEGSTRKNEREISDSTALKLYIAISTSPLTRPGTASMANLLPAHTPTHKDKLVWTRGTLLGKGAFGKGKSVRGAHN